MLILKGIIILFIMFLIEILKINTTISDIIINKISLLEGYKTQTYALFNSTLVLLLKGIIDRIKIFKRGFEIKINQRSLIDPEKKSTTIQQLELSEKSTTVVISLELKNNHFSLMSFFAKIFLLNKDIYFECYIEDNIADYLSLHTDDLEDLADINGEIQRGTRLRVNLKNYLKQLYTNPNIPFGEQYRYVIRENLTQSKRMNPFIEGRIICDNNKFSRWISYIFKIKIENHQVNVMVEI